MVGLLAVAVALVVAVRLGSIPFHLRVPRLTDVAPPISLPLLLAWIPVPLGVAAIAIVDRLLAPLALPLEGEQALIVVIALVTLVGGALAAFISDDLRHATGYLVIADGGLVLLGLRGARPGRLGPDAGLAGRAGRVEDGGRRVVGGDGGPVRDARDPGPPRLAAPLADHGRRARRSRSSRPTGCRAGSRSRRGSTSPQLSGSGIAWLIVLAGLATLPTYVRLLARRAPGRRRAASDGAAPERVTRRRRRQETLPVTRRGRAGGGWLRGGRRPCSRSTLPVEPTTKDHRSKT